MDVNSLENSSNQDKDSQEHTSIPFFFIYFIWWSRNSFVFNDISIPSEEVAGLIVKLTGKYKVNIKEKKIKTPIIPQIVEGVPWVFFDGFNQGHQPRCGAGGILFISRSLFFTI
jgi:hypothetical protein